MTNKELLAYWNHKVQYACIGPEYEKKILETIEALQTTKEKPFDVLQAIRNRDMLVSDTGDIWVYDSAEGYINKSLYRFLTVEALANGVFRLYKDPEIVLENGTLYFVLDCEARPQEFPYKWTVSGWVNSVGEVFQEHDFVPLLDNGGQPIKCGVSNV